MNGVVDVVLNTTGSTSMTELDATQGAHFIPFSTSAETAQIWASLRPQPLKPVKKGSYPGIDEDMLLSTSTDYVAVYDFADEDIVYQLTKAMYQIIPDLAKVRKGWTREGAASLPVVSAFHPGAIRFFKEVGLWDAAHDKVQQDQLQSEQARMAAWKAKQTTTTK